jgi:K+/H+ antiporter YhaU regulatory subunit KhtT
METDVSPSADEVILTGDVLALVGSNKSLITLEKLVMGKE